MRSFGYARVSTHGQDTQAQIDALNAAGCTEIYQETASGGRWNRPELHKLLGNLGQGDVLVVWKLDRLSRSLRDLLAILDKIELSGAGFRSLTESIDTTTASGRMMMHIVAAFAQFEREMLKERTRAGLEAARREGRNGGRPEKLDGKQEAAIIAMVVSGDKTQSEAASLFRVHPSTISRLMSKAYIVSQ
ncbi:MAG: recombinase family protein [Betaproteobacteria bacterium]|nr:recombinase family protein [Betaproteobacteria bacterium]